MADTMRLGSENRRKLYDNLIGDGFDLGSFEDFEKNMKNKDVRRSIYDSAIEAGWELPEYGDFDKDMNSYYTGTKGNLKEVDRATYEGFMQRHPGKQSQKPVSIPKSQPQQRDSVNAENGYVFTEAGLDSLQQGFPARYVGAPANESPANESISTPWGTEGSATGKSRHYTPTAPGQVRSTELPSGSSYQTPYRPNLTAAQRDEIERENNFAIEQNKKLIQGFNNEEERRNKPLVDTGNKTVNQSVIKTQGQWDDELQRGISELGGIISPMVSNAMKKADDTWWKTLGESAQVPRQEGMELTDLKRANDATDPDKILQGLQKSLKAAYDTPEMKAEIEKRANSLGIPKDDYLNMVVAPALQQRLSAEFANSQIASRLPKNTTEYILQGLNNSVFGMLGAVTTQSQSQRRYSTEAQAMTEEGLNPYYNPGTGARLAQMGVTFAADAPFFGLYGRIGGNVVKRVAEQQIKNLMAKGLSEGAARSLVGTALQNSAGARMRQYIMQHVGSSAITMGGFNLTSEGARQAHEGEFDPMKLAGSTAEGLATGAAFGLTGGAAQALTQPLSGISKIGAKIAGFGVEAETLYATEELAKMMHGEEGFTNPFEGSVESLMKLGVMKASSGHPLTKAIETGIGIKQDGFRKTLAKSLSGQATGIKFTPEEEAYVRNSVEGKNLLESLSQMHPEVAVSEVNGKKKLTPEGEKMRQQLSESYNRFMSDTEIPANVKQKVALTLGGLYRPGLETGSDIIHGDDGSVVLKTRDKDGNCIQELHFDSFSDAELWRDEHEADFRLNDAVNMFNGSTVEARAKMLGELMQEYGVDAEQARSMIDAALRGSMGKSFDNEQFLSIYDTIRRNAYPDDELNTQRRYWEGKQLTNEEKHFAVTDLQVAEEQLSLFGQDFADEVMAAKDYPDEKMAELAQRKDITGEQLKAALRYYNQSAKVDGMMDETLKTVDQQVDAANSFIQRNTHPDSGMLIAGTARGNNVYITAGHFTLSPDGRLIPTDNSGAIIVRDANTGEISVVSPNEVTATAVNDPKLLMAANDSMEGLRGQLMKEAENTIELRPDTPTEAANGDIYMGADGNMYMTVQTKDEAGNSVWGKFAVDKTGEPVGNPMPFDIDEYRKAKSDEKDQADKPQEEISVVDGVTESEEETPAPQPEETPETPVVEEQPVQRIPVDEKGHRLFEKAKPEDTLAELTEKYGAEKAQQMIAKIAESTARAFEELSNKDTSKITDMDELAAHEDALTEAEQKMKYWQDLLPKEEPKNDEQITEEPVIEPEPASEPEQKPATPEAPATPAQEPETPVIQPEEPVTPSAEPQTPPTEPEQPSEPQQPAGPTAEQKIVQGTVKNNIGKRFGFQNQDGTRSEIVLDVFKGDDKVTVTRQDFDMDGKPKGKPYSTDFNLVDVGNSIINGVLKPALSPEEKLRKVFKVTVGDVPLIDVLTEDEQQQLLDLHAKKDNEAIGNLTHDLIQSHREDIILKGREIRNSKVASILNSNASREEKLRRIRKLYQSFDEAPVYLEDESMKPVDLEEYVADLHSRVPKSGEGTIAYFSYEKDGTPITGLQDESGYGTKSGGDADAFKPWLAPKGKGMSLMKYAEQIHSQLPEPIQEQFDVNAVRNAILNVFGGAERPSDIPTMIIKRGIIQAEQAARRMEEMMIDDAPSFQKMTVNNNSFTNRLERAKEQTNTEPTDAQKEKGNYKKGHVSFGGYDFVVENPEGSMRRGEADGKKWEQKMNNTYGYILGKFGKDGDHLDMFINDKADLDNWNGNVYVIDQIDPKTGAFDEHKIVYGYDSEAEARDAYLSNYEKGWKGLGKITGVDKATFDKWLDSSTRKKVEFADHSIIKKHMAERVNKAFDSALQKLDEREISIDDPELLKEYGLKNVVLSRYGDHLTLTHFIAEEQGKGNGTRFMNDLARLADHKGWTLAVTPDTSFGGTSVKRLKDFYKRFGFKDNKGRNADFETRESMIRRPKDYQPNSPEKQEKAMRDAVVEHLRQAGIEVSDDWKEGQRILDEYNGRKTVGEEVESDVKPQKVTDQEEVDQLNNGKTVKRYRAMQLIDGKLYPPMSAKVDGEMREPTEIGVWEKAEERPDLVKDGKFVLNKGQKGQGNVPAAYNPYFHTSTSGLNDQFTSAYKRPELVVVEVEIPESELTSGYKAEGAKDAVGDVSWHSGVVNGQLPADRQRQVTLSRYNKVNRIVPDSEVADMIAKQLEGTNVEVPYNVVTPALRAELEKRGVKIGSKPAGSVTEDINGNPIKDSKPRFFKTPDGYAYGYTYRGKIYLDPRIATSETPIHEYGHLWAEMKRQTNPEEWNHIKEVMLNDKLVQPIIDRVKRDYPELAKEGKEDSFVEEVITQFSGKRGNERLREIANEIAEERGGIFGKAEAVTAMQRLKNILNRFWEGVANMMGWKYKNANQIADKILSDMLNGVNPTERMKETPKDIKGQKEDVAARDKEYAEAVAAGDMEKVDAMLREEAKRKGYSEDSSYQGSLAFNGAAPSKNGYFDTREERKQAMDDGTFEDTFSLGDYAEAGIDANDLEWQLANPMNASAGDKATLASIRNINNALKSKSGKIKMYRAVDAAIKENSFRNGDWVTPSREYAEQHIGLQDWKKGRIIEQEVSIDDIWWNGDDINEWGYDDGKGYAYKNTKNNRKLMEPTYDEDGNLIPLSQRFNDRKDDIRFREGEAQQVELGAGQRKLTPRQMRERQAYAERQWRRAHEWANDTVKKLKIGDKVTIIDSIDELEGYEKFPARKKNAKGWYDPETDSIVIVMGNHRSPSDVVKTILHEGVAHHGLRKLFGSNYDTFLDNAYKSATDKIRDSIDDLTKKYDGDVRKATEEYLGKLAEDTEFENAEKRSWVHHWFNQVKQAFLDMLKSIGLKDYKGVVGDISDNELRYILWRSYKNLSEPGAYRNVFQQAKDIAMQNKLAKVVKMPEKGRIEDEIPQMLRNHDDEIAIQKRVNQMSLQEAQDAYKRIDDMMRDEQGRDLDEQFEAHKLEYREKNGLNGIGKFVADDLQSAMDKYGSGMVELRWELQDHILDLGGSLEAGEGKELYREGDEAPKFQKAPVFYSNAEKAVEGIKQEKGTPEQWLAMIQKNGGLKAGEDKWLGLSDWLKQQKGSVTKQDVLDYIRKNQIEVEEVPYQEYVDVDDNPKMQEFRKEFDELVSMYENRKATVEKEMETFDPEMSEKYGYGWANKLEGKDLERYNDIYDRYEKLTTNATRELAFEDMVDRYGDDFSMAFEVNYGNGKLEPQMDMYGDDISDAAKSFLELTVQPINSTRLSYTTEGLENKREIALTVPTIEPYRQDDNIHFGDADNGRAVAWVRFGDTEIHDPVIRKTLDSASEELYDYLDRMSEKYHTNPDYPEDMEEKRTAEEKAEHERIMANIRKYDEADEANTKKVLVIDEIQSKRHQEGRDKGYVDDEKVKAYNDWIDNKAKEFGVERYQVEPRLTDEEYREMKKLQEAADGVPDAPFDKNWHELAMKRMLRYAAENGYDKIAWTTGKQQAERYDLGKSVKRVYTFEPDDYAKEHGEFRNVQIDFLGNGGEMFINIDKDGNIMSSDMDELRGKHLSDALGKDLAEKILNDKPGSTYSGNDLVIGGEGMKGFYDEMLVRFMNKYGKKWGVKVDKTELPDINQTMWSVDVTPEMKESVMQGQPMFQRVSPEAEMTPEDKQYWNKWDAAMKKWKERNALPADADGPGEKPVYQQGELALDYAKRMAAWHRKRNLWQTAPKLEDYRQARDDKSNSEEARAAEMRYPDSEANKRWRVAADLARIRHAMARQKAYDKSTVKAVTDFAQDFMKMGFGDNLSRGEMERMLSSVKNATGAKDIKKYVDNIMNILVDNHLKNLENRVWKLASVKELKQTAQGVETQGKLELKGQRMIQAFRDATQQRMTIEDLQNRMAEVAEKMTSDPSSADMWEQEYEGLAIALQYAENIGESRAEWAELDRNYKDAVNDYKTSGRSYQAQQQLLESIDQAMQENKIERIGMYGDIIGRLEGNISESMQGAKEFVEREKARIKKIHDMANFDLANKPMGAMREGEQVKGKTANFFLSPLGTFEQMLKQFGARNASGEGNLYDYFMRNWMDATDKAYVNETKSKDELDAKAREVFGDKVKRWSDLYELERDLPTKKVKLNDMGEEKTFELTQGNMLYIYMANKMSDGRMKLRKMGITEEDVESIKEKLDPRLITLGDWLQDEYLVDKRKQYNKVHERMFGAPMAAIENYFPIKILGDARVQEEDVNNTPDGETLPSTITGSIIKRRRNTLPLDVLNTDALSLAIEHVEDMERWAAQAEWNRDVNTLLSYTTFRNKVKNMNTIYGSGDQLWNAFKDAARMAAGTYRPITKPGSVDTAISNIAKGVTAAKINFRVYTAFKQLLSAPAFLHDVDLADFAKNSVNPYGSWKWAMENMPVFRKRWNSRQVGDTRLMDDPTDWNMWKTKVVKNATRWGMSPNALVDGVTCAVGAKSIYESRYKYYKKIGASDEVAHKRALQDAEIGYNLTQQSSEGAFVSQIQKDRTVAANMLSVFRNSSMAYTRQWVDAARNLKHRMQPGYKEDSIDFMTRQFKERFDLDDDMARKAAEAAYARAGRHDVARMLNMMFGVTIAWNLGASLPYLLIGDDDKTKKEMMTDALVKGMIAGPSEGFAAGNLISEMVGRATSENTRKTIASDGWGAGIDAALKQVGDYEVNPLPLMADIQSTIEKMGYDKFAAAQDVFNICMQSAVGVNPQTFTDMWNAIMDYAAPGWDGTSYTFDKENMTRAKELALFFMRIANAPTSSWRNKYIDELGMNAEDAKKLPYDELAQRYAHYKHWKDAPMAGWLRGEEGRAAKIEKIQGQFDDAVQERIERLTDEELKHNVARSKSLDERRMIARTIAKRLGITQSVDGKKAKEEWQQNYQHLMTFEDIREDEMLYQKKHEASERGDNKTVKAIDRALEKIKERGKKKLGFGDDQEKMELIRQWRREALEKAIKAEGSKQE